MNKDPELVEDEEEETPTIDEFDLPEYDEEEFTAVDDLYYVGGKHAG